METEATITIGYKTAFHIAKLLKESRRALDREIKTAKDNAVGELTLNVLRTKRKAVKAAYDELKAAGVELEDTTIVL